MRRRVLLATVAALTLASAAGAGAWWWNTAVAPAGPGILSKVSLAQLTPSLRDGDLVFRRGTGLVSWYAAEASGGGYFSHVGLLRPQGDGWRVVHSEADERTGIGGIRDDSLEHFLDGAQGVAVVRLRLTPDQLDAITALSADPHWLAIPFDADFRLDDGGASMYCTEWVQALVLAATGEDIARPRSRFAGRDVISVDDLLHGPHAEPILDHRL